MQVIQNIKRIINHSSDRVKKRTYFRRRREDRQNPNSIRRVINKHNPKRASLLLLPSLAVVAVFMAVAVSTVKYASAEDLTETENLDFSITSEKSLGVTLSGASVNLSINPTAEGQFGRKSMWIDVSTNNKTGYTLSVKANETATLTRSAKVNGTSYAISPLTANVTCATESDTACSGWSANNVWGYRSDGWDTTNVYKAMTTSLVPIKTTTAPANESKTTVYFASQLNNAIPTGDYSGVSLDFIAVTNEVPLVIGDIEYLQDLYGISDSDKMSLLASMTEGAAYTKTDKRDNKPYIISKLKDGKIWFLDNLRLDLTSVSLDDLKGDTNASNTTLDYLKNGGGSSPYATGAVQQNMASNYTVPYINITKIEYAATSNNWGNGSHKYGVFYNYCAASAGSYCYASGSGSGNATEDVCPAGWRMPTSGSSGDYKALANIYANTTATGTNSLQYNLSTPLSGDFASGSLNNQGTYGVFWPSTYNDGIDMYDLVANPSYVNPQGNHRRYSGHSVRCVFGS